MKYSVTTVSLPDLDMQGQCKLLRELGFDGIELRVRRCSDELRAKGVPSNWGYHVNDVTPENVVEKAPELRKIMDDNGIALAGFATNMSCVDLEQFKLALDGAVALKAPFIRLGGAAGFTGKDTDDYKAIYGETVAGYARCVALARGTGVRLLMEIHGNTIHPSVSLAYKIVSNFSPSEVGLIYDPQNMVRDGFETTALVVPMAADYIAHCHFGGHRPFPGEVDANGTRQWKWERCSMAEGLFDFPAAMKQLKKINFGGFISIEDFSTDIPHAEKLSEGLAYLKRLEAL